MLRVFKKDKKSEKKLQTVNDEEQGAIKEVLIKEKLPIVVLDPLWHAIKSELGSHSISKKEERLKELLKQRGKLTNDYKDYLQVKQKMLNNILTLSKFLNEDEDSSKIEELDKYQNSVIMTNEKLDSIDQQIKQVEIDIEVINREIVEETISIGYGYIRTYAQVQSDLQEEIDHLRAEVVKKTEEKKKYEQQMTHLYTYLHSVIGYEQISKVDRKLWKK
jgi:hypothetical protein